MINDIYNLNSSQPEFDFIRLQSHLYGLKAEQRIEYILNHFDSPYALTSSFGAQSAVCLHLLTQQQQDIPVILIDTGYLFPETYQFIDQLCDKLQLNLKVYKSKLSPAWLESRYGRLWTGGLAGITKFNNIMKVAPLQQAFDDLAIKVWFSGIRNSQSESRKDKSVIEQKNNHSHDPILKVHPIIDWTDRDIYNYLKKHDLPYHPLWEKGYVSIGDMQTSQPLSADMNAEDSRFFGLKRECGIHD